jgi:hypothetical protein
MIPRRSFITLMGRRGRSRRARSRATALLLVMSVYGTALPSLRCSKIRHYAGIVDNAAGPAGAQVRGLMPRL